MRGPSRFIPLNPMNPEFFSCTLAIAMWGADVYGLGLVNWYLMIEHESLDLTEHF